MMSGRNGFRSISRHAELEVALVLAVTSITAFAWCGTTLGTTFSGGPPLIPHDLTNGVDASPTEPQLALPSSNSHGMARVFPPADRASHLVDLRTWNPNLLGSGPQYYTQEPAPMGIADFGTNYSGENDPYIANSFIANATIYVLSASGGNGPPVCALPPSDAATLTFQLNAVLSFTINSQTFSYWVQDVAVIDTVNPTQGAVTYQDNVWNFTNSPSNLQTGTISWTNPLGALVNSGLGGNVYEACAVSSLDGNGATYNSGQRPAKLQLQLNDIEKAGVPTVQIAYYSTVDQDFVIYDSVSFPWAVRPQSLGFWVTNEVKPKAQGANDVEWVMGGGGTGTNSALGSTIDVYMSPLYNLSSNLYSYYQWVPNAQDAGFNTAEGVSNALVTGSWGPDGAEVTAGSGQPGMMLYWSNPVSFKVTSSPSGYPKWTVIINGPGLALQEGITGYGTENGTALSVEAPDGSYSWYVSLPSGLEANPSQGQVQVAPGTSATQFSISASGGHGGGCVVYGTPILTLNGYIPIQLLSPGQRLVEFNLTTQSTFLGSLRYANATNVSAYVSIDYGLLYLTPTDQPIYIENSTFTGWLRDPQNLTVGDRMFDPITTGWVSVRSVVLIQHADRVYNVVTSAFNNFVADGILLDSKH